MKHKKHNEIVTDYDTQKSIHLEKLANKILHLDQKLNKLKDKKIKGNFLKNF